MEKIKVSLKWLLNLIPGSVFGFLAIFIGIIANSLAVSFKNNFGIFNMVSELGVGPGGFFFNVGLIISAVIVIPFYFALEEAVRVEGVNDKMANAALNFSMVSVFFYGLIGVFPAVPENDMALLSHGIVAAISISCGIVYLTLYSLSMRKSSEFSKFQANLGLVVAGLYIIFVFSWWSVIEWIMGWGFLLWISTMSIYLFKQGKNYKNQIDI